MYIDFEIQKVKEGNTDAFKRFFEYLYPRLIGLACRFVDDETAKDLVQDVFADYWVKKQILDVENVSSYLSKSIQNKCLNHIKHHAVVDGYATNVKVAHARMEYLTNNNDNNELFRQISDQNIRELIDASVAKLPPKCQEAFKLCFFHEMTSKEAAELMGLSSRTVEGHVQKAVVQLRKDLHPLIYWLLFSSMLFQN